MAQGSILYPNAWKRAVTITRGTKLKSVGNINVRYNKDFVFCCADNVQISAALTPGEMIISWNLDTPDVPASFSGWHVVGLTTTSEVLFGRISATTLTGWNTWPVNTALYIYCFVPLTA